MTSCASHRVESLPILVLMPHNRCNCRCVMCDIWKIRRVREITEDDLAPHLSSMRALGVRWIVLTGGEPLLHSDLGTLCGMLRRDGARLTLLTSGVSLARHAADVAAEVDDVIVSLDGPPGVHDRIRNVGSAFRRLAEGVRALRGCRPQMPVHGRCTVQKENCRYLCDTVRAAHALRLDSISFLATDLTSSAFNREAGWSAERRAAAALTPDDADALELEIAQLTSDFQKDVRSGFILESPAKLHRISRHFRAHLNQVPAGAPRCNAPWVSAVIDADLNVRPCFFHEPIGSLRDRLLADVLNGEDAIAFRQQLDVRTNPICRNCVCSLFLREGRRT